MKIHVVFEVEDGLCSDRGDLVCLVNDALYDRLSWMEQGRIVALNDDPSCPFDCDNCRA